MYYNMTVVKQFMLNSKRAHGARCFNPFIGFATVSLLISEGDWDQNKVTVLNQFKLLLDRLRASEEVT